MSDLDPRIEGLLMALRSEPSARPEALSRLHAALREEDARAARRVFSPRAALAAATALVVLTSTFWLTLGWWSGWGGPQRVSVQQELAFAQFVLHAADARSVSVVGDFNDWDPDATPLVEAGEGVWSAVVRVRPGLVRYSFLVDGTEWRADPRGLAAHNDFGRATSVAFIGASEAL